MRYIKWAVVLLALGLLLCGCGKQEPTDPYEGMVQVETGFGTKTWIKPIEGIPVNEIGPEDFAEGVYIGSEYEVLQGIDVSEHQGAVDWEAVAADGIDFAIIRAGYRGYSKGGLFTDLFFEENMSGAAENGVDIGVYFFSQATNAEEAAEEAEYLIGLLSDYAPGTVSLPVFYDWESIDTDEARTDGLGGEVITECALAFCEAMETRGYKTGVYFYRNLGYYSYDLSRLSHLTWWAAALNDYPDFYYKHSFWQYSITGAVEGIDGDVDRNMMFVSVVTEAETAQAQN